MLNGFDIISKWIYSSHYKLKHVTRTNMYTKIAGPTDIDDINISELPEKF
jgi:hypothetical protein